MFIQRWVSVVDGGPTLDQHRANVLCMLGSWVWSLEICPLPSLSIAGRLWAHQNLPRVEPKIYPPSQIYPTFHFLWLCKVSLAPTIYLFIHFPRIFPSPKLYAKLPEYTPSFIIYRSSPARIATPEAASAVSRLVAGKMNMPPFFTTICDAPRIFYPECTPFSITKSPRISPTKVAPNFPWQ